MADSEDPARLTAPETVHAYGGPESARTAPPGPRDPAESHDHGHGLLREGMGTGAIGATAVALWFLAVDVLAGRPLFTPAVLGGMVAAERNLIAAAEGSARLWLAALYTPIHFIMFGTLGVAAVALVRRAERTPAVLGLLFMLFLAVEVAFMGFVAVLEQGALGVLAWYQIAAGNLIAVLTMGFLIYRRHRGTATAWSRQFASGES
jgi:hypothetical protein